MAVEQAGVLAARPIEIIRGFLDQPHAFLEDLVNCVGGGEARKEIDEALVDLASSRHARSIQTLYSLLSSDRHQRLPQRG